MSTLSLFEMHEYQRRLQAKYAVKWGEPIGPNVAVRKLCWAYGELAEAGDIMKKLGDRQIMDDPQVRRDFTEEIGDVMMYLFDVLLCVDISIKAFSDIYRAKCGRNMNRWIEDSPPVELAPQLGDTLTLSEMFDYQALLQRRYAGIWREKIEPAGAVAKLLWAYVELGEIGDIINKSGIAPICDEPEVRSHFAEEIGDVVMFLIDILRCYAITAGDFSKVYRAKCERNANRWD